MTHYYVVVDDGTRGVLRPWIVNRDIARGREMGGLPMDPDRRATWLEEMVRPFFEPGDEVTLIGQPWSRYVRSLVPAARLPR